MNYKEFLATTEQLGKMVAQAEVQPKDVFAFAIAKMNEMYTLPVNVHPTLAEDHLGESPIKRIQGFLKTLQKEVDEGHDIIRMLEHKEAVAKYMASEESNNLESTNHTEDAFKAEQVAWEWITPNDDVILDEEELDEHILTALADWFGDLAVYGRSEAMKFGIPLEAVLNLIMGSNFTKLNADGSVIKDVNGKVQKGPFFKKPEPAIRALLFKAPELLDEHFELVNTVETAGAVAAPALLSDAVPEEFFQDEYIDDEDESEDDDE